MSDYIILDADSLASKFGFWDGDLIGDWWWDNFDEPMEADGYEDEGYGAEHSLLIALVRKYLVPKLGDPSAYPEIIEIITSHNPIRFDTSVNVFEIWGEDPSVTISKAEIMETFYEIFEVE